VSTARGRLPGPDAKRQAATWRCPTGACTPASRWIGASRLHTLIPRGTARWKPLYRLRGSVEWENGRRTHDWALLPLRVRRIERVALHADLAILARLATALATARAVPLAASAALPRAPSPPGLPPARKGGTPPLTCTFARSGGATTRSGAMRQPVDLRIQGFAGRIAGLS
jgi:hypothetical protein